MGSSTLRLLRLANPLVGAVLESPAHRALSGQLVLLSYRGHRTGRGFRIPLRYAVTADGAIVAVALTPGEKLWWRSFSSASSATLTLRGARREAIGTLVEGSERETALAAYTARHPRAAGLARDAAVVVFTPATG